MTNSIDTVLFDMDGLMLDTERIYRRAWQRAASDLGHDLPDEQFATFIGVKTEECEEMFAAIIGAPLPLKTFRALRQTHWDSHVAMHGIAIKPGLLEILQLLDTHKVRKGVVTSTPYAEAVSSLNHAGISERFDCITTGDQVVNPKPAPDIYLLAANRLNSTPDRCLVFEDSEAGVRAASAAGMRVILIPDLIVPSAEVTEEAYAVMASLSDAADLMMSWLPGQTENESGPAAPGCR